MRTAGSAILVIVALLLAGVAGPALWLQRNVVDQAGFVQLAEPLGSNTEFQSGLTALATSQAMASLSLPSQLDDLATTIIGKAARGIYSDPGYEQAWNQTLQRSHQLSFEAAGNDEVQGDLKVDIAPLIDLVAANVSDQVGLELPTPADVVVSVEQPEVARILPLLSTLGGWGGWLAFIAVGLLILGVVVARRRSLAVILAGAGLAVVALVWFLVSSFVETLLSGLVEGNDTAQQVGIQLGALARDSWQGGITGTFVVAGLLVVAGGVATLMVKRRRTT